MKARLYISDGSVFEGESFGYEGSSHGELVFNTGMVGYPETLTDPSYKGQILVSTYPLQGNYGVPDMGLVDSFGIKKFFESNMVHVSAFVVSQYSLNYNHSEAFSSLGDFLKSQKIPAITGIDTRALTKKIREQGCLMGKIVVGDEDGDKCLFSQEDTQAYLEQDFVSLVSRKKVDVYGNGKKRICVLDMGVKNNILRSLLKYDTTLIVVPHDYPFMNGEIDFDGLFISNGPGDPARNISTILEIKKAIDANKSIFGICLGNQLLALAGGAKTYKLKYGHRGQNQPCRDVFTGKCIITSQNHGYAIDESTLPADIVPWFTNINDQSNEGIIFKDKNISSVQFHPENFPGPTESEYLFEEFVASL